MVLELHAWGPAFGLPSIEAECIATIAYCQRVIPQGQWVLVADYDHAVVAAGSLPLLYHDGIATASGVEDIIAYLRNYSASTEDLDANLTTQQLTDRTALVTFLQATAMPLIDLSLYVSAENYNSTTSSAYTAMLPWYANYTVPARRRCLAKSRTAHMGLSSLEIASTNVESVAPGRGTASSEYEAAKEAAGIPLQSQPRSLRVGRGRGIGGFLGAPAIAARFKLDALSNELLEPLADLLGRNDYLLQAKRVSSLDCLAFGYLSLLFYPQVPQAWVKETIQTRFPHILSYIGRLRKELFSDDVVNPAAVWSISTRSVGEQPSTLLPWQPKLHDFTSKVRVGAREIVESLPLVSTLTHRTTVVHGERRKAAEYHRSLLPSALLTSSLLGVMSALAVGLASCAVRHRRSPRDEALIFWALRPSTGLGKAGNILSVLAHPSVAGRGFSQV